MRLRRAALADELCYDGLALQASVHILRKYASVQFKLPSSQGRFRPIHARLIEDYIDENISKNITLEELANICNCTPVEFARKFCAHYGVPAARLCAEPQGGPRVPIPS